MRCYCCNNILTPKEATRKFAESGVYTEMCDECLETISDEGLDTIEGNVEDENIDEDEE